MLKLKNLTINQKLILIGFITIIGYFLGLVMDLSIDRESLYAHRKRELQRVTSLGIGILKSYDRLYRTGVLSLERAQDRAVRLIRLLKFGDDDRFFLIDANGQYLAHTIHKELVLEKHQEHAQNFEELQKQEQSILQNLITASDKRENIIQHYELLPNGEKKEKISITARFEPWGWIIGTGILVEDIETTFWKNVIKECLFLLPILSLIFLTICMVARSISSPLQQIFKNLLKIGEGYRAAHNKHVDNATELEKIHAALNIVKAMTENLQDTIQKVNFLNKKLEKSNAELEDFASIISHDLQTPIRRIAIYCSLLREERYDRATSAEIKYLDTISVAAYKMKRLTYELLEISKIRSYSLNKIAIDLNQCFEEALRENDIYMKDIHFKIVKDELPVVMADPLLITQVFYNLINNAIKFRKEDEDLQIVLQVIKVKKYWRLSLSDNGIGIHDKAINSVFKPFRRSHQKNVPGRGLGLAICKRILEKHDGEIWIDTKYKVGTKFYLILPCKLQEGEQQNQEGERVA